MTFGPVESFDLPALEARTLARWDEHDIIRHVQHLRDGGEPWTFYEGPPTANGRPGVHHVWARAFKDLYPRFQTMRGRSVPRKGGWDCHGLPVELEVEKQLGFTAKHQIEEYGIGAFNDLCRESVRRYVGDWADLTARSGVWIDTDDAYWTMTNDYIETVWWLVKRMWDRGLLYEGHRVSPYCTRCGTALSSHEMGQPDVYQDVVDTSVYVRFPLRDDDADLLVWTTTPWTLISNVAVAIGADMDYVRVHEPDGRDLVMAEAAAERFFGEGAPYKVVERYRGTDLVGRRYERPYTFLPLDGPGAERAETVYAADYVTADDGSGAVHIAPAFGEADADLGRLHDLPVLNPVDAEGRFVTAVTPWAGLHVRTASEEVVTDLRMHDLLVRQEAYEHSYPHCWRCKTPLIYWAKRSWFARTSTKREALLRENEKINWYPGHIKDGRFGNWLGNNIDWALSRDRYWGTPLPVWRCEQGHDTCIGSVAELSRLAGRELSDLDLHRPAIDEVTVSCPECDGPATRLAPVLDAWFDSGSMPAAQHHYPFDEPGADPDAAAPSRFPADFICEAIDQTRGWFYSLLAVNTLAFDSTPYRNVVCLGHIVDGEGRKMSKSLGNVLDPWNVFDNYGADGVRWYFFSMGQPWTPRRLSEDGIREATRQTLVTLWNVWSFFATYADLDGWQPDPDTRPEVTHTLDRWVLGQLDDTIAEMTEAFEGYDALRASERLARFVDDLSNWYLRRSRPRFWKQPDPAAYWTLHRCLTVAAELLAPICPFLADDLWTRLTGGLTVHAADWPATAGFADAALAAEVDAVRRLVFLGRSARNDGKVKTRQPLRRAMLLHPGATLGPDARAELESELNVKLAESVDDVGDVVTWTIVPNFRALGPRLGPRINEMKSALAEADGAALKAALDADGFVEVIGERLDADDIEIRVQPNPAFSVGSDAEWAVVLDLTLDEELLVEGVARELSRLVNDQRKQVGCDISERVAVVVEAPADGRVAAAIVAHGEWLSGEALSAPVRLESGVDGARLELDGETVVIAVERPNA